MRKRIGMWTLLSLVGTLTAVLITGCGTSDVAGEVEVSGGSGQAAATPAQDTSSLEVGKEVSRDGVTVGVLSVVDGPADWAGDPTVKVTVHYKNETEESLSFGEWDWSVESAGGVRSDTSMVDGETLGTGELAPGGEITGDVYLPAKDAAKIVFTSNMLFDSEDDLLVWIL